MKKDNTKKSTEELLQEGLTKAFSYQEYRDMVVKLAVEEKSTGPEQTAALAHYTELNNMRMKRFDKTVKIDADTINKIESISKVITLLVLTESWCGDAAPTLPVMNKIAEINSNINFRILLRDENIALMNRYLTNGAMSIPKLIFLNVDNTPFASWGPRPEPAAQSVLEHKQKHGELLPEIKEEIQHWYNKDKGRTTLQEIIELLPIE